MRFADWGEVVSSAWRDCVCCSRSLFAARCSEMILSCFALSLCPDSANFSGYLIRNRSRRSVGRRVPSPSSASSHIARQTEPCFSNPLSRFKSSTALNLHWGRRYFFANGPLMPISASCKATVLDPDLRFFLGSGSGGERASPFGFWW